jgi:hypothetical protein
MSVFAFHDSGFLKVSVSATSACLAVEKTKYWPGVFSEIQSHAERNRAQSVQKRVEGRQKHPAPGEISRSMMHVQQPQQE